MKKKRFISTSLSCMCCIYESSIHPLLTITLELHYKAVKIGCCLAQLCHEQDISQPYRSSKAWLGKQSIDLTVIHLAGWSASLDWSWGTTSNRPWRQRYWSGLSYWQKETEAEKVTLKLFIWKSRSSACLVVFLIWPQLSLGTMLFLIYQKSSIYKCLEPGLEIPLWSKHGNLSILVCTCLHVITLSSRQRANTFVFEMRDSKNITVEWHFILKKEAWWSAFSRFHPWPLNTS